MGHKKDGRKAINGLSERAGESFRLITNAELGELVAVPELCTCLECGPKFFAFSCLSGDQEKRVLGENLGTLFTDRKVKITEKFLGSQKLLAIIDDTEPIRIWQWDTPQEEITFWCKLVVENSVIPDNWDVRLWSEIEKQSEVRYLDVLSEVEKPEHALAIHHRLEHMKAFPNKKLRWVKDLRHAAKLRVAQYALQGIVLEKDYPTAILVQGETPWAVKDPLYQTMRRAPLPIIHPFEERR